MGFVLQQYLALGICQENQYYVKLGGTLPPGIKVSILFLRQESE